MKMSDGELQLEQDADFAADKSDRTSLTKGIIRLNGKSVIWTAKKKGRLRFPRWRRSLWPRMSKRASCSASWRCLCESASRLLSRCHSTSTAKQR
uniref:Uncharacterized protein n=1 Tax=Peronospora matthiolae TaxID=2874970 RepID=A0AAV1TQP1_9STRA